MDEDEFRGSVIEIVYRLHRISDDITALMEQMREQPTMGIRRGCLSCARRMLANARGFLEESFDARTGSGPK